jgi:hypothetical protein
VIYREKKFCLEGRIYSPYVVGFVGAKWVREARNEYRQIDYECKNIGFMHHKMVKKYLKERNLLLYKWFEETKTPFGGLIGGETDVDKHYPFYPVHILFIPGSIEETAFRMCFETKAMSS